MATVTFPKLREELLELAQEDQQEIRSFSALHDQSNLESKMRLEARLARHCHARARRMIKILDIIRDPTVGNIGLDGLQAMSLLALHSYLDVMKRVMAVFERQFAKSPEDTYPQAIPPLRDRISILESRKQLFGTNWMMDKDGKPFLVSVDNFPGVDERRAHYGLKPIRRPTNLAIGAVKYPLGRGLAREADQKNLTDEEYDEYSRYHLRTMKPKS